MCMKNMNATLLTCSEVEMNNTVSFKGIYDYIVPCYVNGMPVLDELNIVLNAIVLFGKSYENDDYCIQLDTPYEIKIRLTHIQSGLGITLFEEDLVIKEEDLTKWCKDFYEMKKIISVSKLDLPQGLGNYAVKLLIRKKTDNKNSGWHTQTIHRLLVDK